MKAINRTILYLLLMRPGYIWEFAEYSIYLNTSLAGVWPLGPGPVGTCNLRRWIYRSPCETVRGAEEMCRRRARARRRIVLVFGATRFVVVRPLAGCSRGAHAWRLPPCGSSLMNSQKKAEISCSNQASRDSMSDPDVLLVVVAACTVAQMPCGRRISAHHGCQWHGSEHRQRFCRVRAVQSFVLACYASR